MTASASSPVSREARLLPPQDWRGLARLALEGLATGVFVSVVLALAVFIVASQADAAPLARASDLHAADAHGGAMRLAASGDEPATAALLVATEVRIDVSGIVARTTLTQRFVNPTPVWREGVYLFALPDKAAVDHLRLVSGGRVIEGEVQERAAARKRYDEAKRSGRQAGLVDQARPNLFTTRVAHLAPDAEVVVTIEYQEALRYDAGTFSLRLPLAITPRYLPADRPAAASGAFETDPTPGDADNALVVAPFHLDESRAPVTIEVTLDAGFPLASVESASHAIRVERGADHKARVTLADDVVPADRDLELAWKPAVGAEPGAAVFTERRDGRTYALVMVLPPSVEAAGPALPREATFVVDTSGSMSGVSIVQAKEATLFALSRLKPGDRFNVIEFNSRTRTLFGAPMAFDAKTLDAARAFVGALVANGGTEMKPALEAALAPESLPGYARQVFFLTDGAVGNEHELLKLVRSRLGDRRLYTVAIGPAPNAWFIRKAAQFGRGTATFIGDVRDVRERMTALFAKLERPALTDLAITWPVGAEVYPPQLPDLYDGEPIVVSASFAGAPSTLSIVGRRGRSAWGALLATGAGTPSPGVGALWARERIATLSDAIIEGSPEDEVRPLIVATALEHHLVSRYTSLVAVDTTPTAPAGTASERTPIPGLLPAGLDASGFVGSLPQTATPAPLLLVIGLSLGVLAWVVRRVRVQRSDLIFAAQSRVVPTTVHAIAGADPRSARSATPRANVESDSNTPLLAVLLLRADVARRVC
ncbi:MAG: marine proteobacterial sortase target protein [Betaproteobacteria bacterium]